MATFTKPVRYLHHAVSANGAIRWYWMPSARLRREGHAISRLKPDGGAPDNPPAEVIAAAERHNAALDAARGIAPRLPKVRREAGPAETTLRRKLLEANGRARLAEERLRAMEAKQPGLLSGVEILARAVPAREIAQPAVYFLIDGFEIVYVGQTTDLSNRIRAHLAERQKSFSRVASIRCDEADLLRIEAHYIRALAPRYNATQSPMQAAG